jgi:hypothetical protein
MIPWIYGIRPSSRIYGARTTTIRSCASIREPCRPFGTFVNGKSPLHGDPGRDEEPAPLDLSRFTGLIQCWLSGSPVLERLALTNRVTQSFWLAGCGVTEIDIHGQVQVYDLEAPGNPLIAVDISGCSGLRTLDLAGCGLDQAQVDSILATMEGFGTWPEPTTPFSWRGILPRPHDAQCPSFVRGMDHADALRSRGWTVVCNVAESPM